MNNQEIAQQFVEGLNQPTSDWKAPWTNQPVCSDGNVLPVNATTNRPYSGRNFQDLCNALDTNGYTVNRWLTYKQCKNAGGYVRKGEKGTSAVMYRTYTVRDNDEDVIETKTIKKGFTVFNVEQCEDLPNHVRYGGYEPVSKKATFKVSQSVHDLLAKHGVNITHTGNIACYNPSKDRIEMPPVELFLDEPNYCATLFHELVHWTGHKSRLNRPGIVSSTKSIKSQQYAVEEFIAEIGSAFLCNELNIEGDTHQQAYINSWASYYKDEEKAKNAILKASKYAQEAIDYLT